MHTKQCNMTLRHICLLLFFLLFFLVMFIWVVVYSLFNAAPIVGLMFGPRFSYAALIVLSCFAIISLSKKELVALF